MKLKLLYNHQYGGNIVARYLEPLWDQYFERVPIDDNTVYDPTTSIVYADFPTADLWIKPWRDQNFKIVVDHLWDGWINDKWVSDDNLIVLRNLDWFRYNESLWFTSLGYNNYFREPNDNKSFLLLMNKARSHRMQLYHKIKDLLSDAIYSLQGSGIPLTNAKDIPVTSSCWDRFTDPDWYNSTRFSLVAETGINANHPGFNTIRVENPLPICTEKSYKPFAFYHPMVIWGSPGILSFLQNQGFETFSNVIDESYDKIQSDGDRLDEICNLVRNLNVAVKEDKSYMSDTITQDKLKHNFHLFYNRELAVNYFKKQIVDQILDYANG